MSKKASNNILFNCRQKDELDKALKTIADNGLNIDRTHILNELVNMFIEDIYPHVKKAPSEGTFFTEIQKIRDKLNKD